MIISTMPRKAVVQYVEDMLRDFEIGLQSITITSPAKSEDFSAFTVIGISSEDIDDPMVQDFSWLLMNISTENTQGG